MSELRVDKIQSKNGGYIKVKNSVEYVTDLANVSNPEVNDICIVTDENRGGTFIYKGTGTDDSGTIFSGWHRQYEGAVNVKWFGAAGDGVTDDRDSSKNALDEGVFGANVWLDKGTYLIKSPLNIEKFASSLIGKNTHEVVIKVASDFVGSWAIDTYVSSSPSQTTTGFKFEKFTLDLNNVATNGLRLWRPYDNCELLDINIINGHADYVHLQIGNTTSISQTLYCRNVSVLPYGDSNVEPVEIYRLQESQFDICKFWGSKYILGTPYTGTVSAAIIQDCKTITWNSPSFVSAKGVKVRTVNNLSSGFMQFNNPLFEDCTGKFLLSGASSSNVLTNVDISNPRYESPSSGDNVFGAYVNQCNFETNQAYGNIVVEANASYNTIRTAYFDIVSDSGTNTNIVSTSNATTSIKYLNNSTVIRRGNTPKIGLEIDNTSTTVNDTNIYWNASQTTDYGLYIKKSGVNGIRLYDSSGVQRTQLLQNNTPQCETTAFGFRPTSDNTISLGSNSTRWSEVYAGAGTINTSDDREKTYLSIEDAEKQVALEIKANMKKFKFNDAIETKGVEKARIHFGTSAQTVKSIFEAHGLNAENYALFCYDTWETEYDNVLVEEAFLDENGNTIKEAVYEEQIVKEAGDRYGIRYEELLCFIVGAL